jgi:hypothetical protein
MISARRKRNWNNALCFLLINSHPPLTKENHKIPKRRQHKLNLYAHCPSNHQKKIQKKMKKL